jgi:hypothetical protein
MKSIYPLTPRQSKCRKYNFSGIKVLITPNSIYPKRKSQESNRHATRGTPLPAPIHTRHPATEKENREGGRNRRKNQKGKFKLVSWCIIKVLRYNSVNAQYVILEILLILQPHLTDFALEPISFFNVGQIFPLKMLRQVARFSKFVSTFLER